MLDSVATVLDGVATVLDGVGQCCNSVELPMDRGSLRVVTMFLNANYLHLLTMTQHSPK